MKRMNIGLLVALFLFAQAAISFSETFTLEELTGDDAPKTVVGWVLAIDHDSGSILMGDTRFRFKKDTFYLSTDNKPTDKTSFTEDMAVRFLSEGRDILAIWHVDDPDDEYRPREQRSSGPPEPEEIAPVTSEPSELDGVIRKENGVWTN